MTRRLSSVHTPTVKKNNYTTYNIPHTRVAIASSHHRCMTGMTRIFPNWETADLICPMTFDTGNGGRGTRYALPSYEMPVRPGTDAGRVSGEDTAGRQPETAWATVYHQTTTGRRGPVPLHPPLRRQMHLLCRPARHPVATLADGRLAEKCATHADIGGLWAPSHTGIQDKGRVSHLVDGEGGG